MDHELAPDSEYGGWFFANRILDAIFLTDLLLQFNLAFPNKQGSWIKDRRLIISHYLRTWFLLDLVGQAPLALEIMSLVQGADGEGDEKNVMLVRIIRAVRLIKLARLLRTARLLNRWKSRITIPYSTVCVHALARPAHTALLTAAVTSHTRKHRQSLKTP